MYKAYEIADDYIGRKYPALMKHMHIRYIRDSINFLYMASPLKDKYPEVIKDISGRLHVKDIPGYIFGPSGWKSKAAMVFAALTPALAVKVFALIQKQH